MSAAEQGKIFGITHIHSAEIPPAKAQLHKMWVK